jgi:hypothetical protein
MKTRVPVIGNNGQPHTYKIWRDETTPRYGNDGAWGELHMLGLDGESLSAWPCAISKRSYTIGEASLGVDFTLKHDAVSGMPSSNLASSFRG